MKKLILSLLLLGSLVSAQGAIISLTIPAAGMSNLFLFNSPVRITQITAASAASTAANVGFMDTYTNQLGFTNAAFITTSTYATNVISLYTNYYGATNTFTNVAIVDVTNTVAATTWLYPIKAQIPVPTNTTLQIDALGASFTRGCWVTNSGNGTATVTVTYQK